MFDHGHNFRPWFGGPWLGHATVQYAFFRSALSSQRVQMDRRTRLIAKVQLELSRLM
jgi:hypothetical protein